jgi:chromatin remodeling complex protein RSC6
MANSKKTSTQATTATQATPAVASVAQATPATPAVAPVEKKEKKVAAPSTTATATATTTTPASASKKSSSKKSETAASTAAPSSVAATTEAVPEADEEKKGRRVVSRESIDEDFSDLIVKISSEIEKRAPPAATPEATNADGTAAAASKKSTKRKKADGVPIKFLRTIKKRLESLQVDVNKQTKLKKKTQRNNENSGLMKPVNISENLYKFLKSAGAPYEVEKGKMYPRVEITRRIHTYVKENNLRKESDKRVIIPDSKLSELLKYDAKTATEEMTYFRLPQYLKSHFISA